MRLVEPVVSEAIMTRRDRSSGSVEGHHVMKQGTPQPSLILEEKKKSLKSTIKDAMVVALECDERSCWLHLKLAFVALNHSDHSVKG